jgi:3-hydroxyacyl-CoA dehydrogenase
MRLDRIGAVAVLVMTHPPVNTLTGALQQALLHALDDLAADPEIRAVILRGEGRGFSAGADIREAGQGARMAELSRLCLRIEDFPKPVIAALHGTALGGGCELALAAHYRIANSATLLGLPEVGLGLLPGAGTTQRLPRLIGAEQALRLMLTGMPVRAGEALALGLLDRVVSENLGEAALAMAQEGLPPRPTSGMAIRDIASHQTAVAAARAALRPDAVVPGASSPLPAPARIVDCVEAAALLPFAMGLNMEAAAFEDLAASPQAKGLHQAFVTERRALQVPPVVAGRTPPPLETLGILGAEDPAADLALQALTAGLKVTLCDADRARLADTLGRIAAKQDQAVAAGQMTEDLRDAAWARLSSSQTPEALLGRDLVLLAPEEIDRAMGGGATPIVALPDGLPCAVMGAVAASDDLCGAGLTVPEAAGGLAELSFDATAAPDLILRLVALGRRLNWRVVTVGAGGPVELGLRLALEDAEQHLLAEGQTPEAIAAALKAFGLGAGLLRHLPPMPHGGRAIVQTCLAALAAEGGRMLQDGRARRPCDIDAVALMSGLIPRWHGGPMYLADQRGLLVLRADLRKLASPVFAVPQVLDDLISEGQKFADLDQG